MGKNLFNPSELRYLWKTRGNKNYDLKRFITSGTFTNCMLFEDLQNRHYVLGKIVTNPREGEAYHWPRLQHENLAPLLDTVSINEELSIYILPVFGRILKIAIHDCEFMMNLESFNRKRAYSEDILLALDYLHSKSLCILNLTELVFYVSAVADRAILCDFHCVHLIAKAKKEDLDLPILYKAPELNTDYFDPIPSDTWACGVVFLQLFTNNILPSGFIGEEFQPVLQAVKELNCKIIKEANPGAQINLSMVEELKTFLDMFLVEDPKLRVNVREAVASPFLQGLTRVKVNDDFRSAFWGCNDDFGSYWEFGKSKPMSSNTNLHSKHFLSPFEDIYLTEVANCREKLKKIPCTNKFINLKFIRQGADMPKYPNRNKSTENKNTSTAVFSKEERTSKKSRSSATHPEHKLKKYITYNNGITSTALNSAENFKSSTSHNDTANSDVEKMSNSFGRNFQHTITEEASKNKETYNTSTLYNKNTATDTSENDENSKCPGQPVNNETNISNSAKLTSNFGDLAEKVVKNEIYHSISPSHNTDDANNENFKSSCVFNDNAKSDLTKIGNNFGDVAENVVRKEVYHSISSSHTAGNGSDENSKSSKILNDNTTSSDLEEILSNFGDLSKDDVKIEVHQNISAFHKIGKASDENSKSSKTRSDTICSNLDEIPGNFGDVEENDVRDELYHNISAFHKIDIACDENAKSSNIHNDTTSSDFEEIARNFKNLSKNGEKIQVHQSISDSYKIESTSDGNSKRRETLTDITSSNLEEMPGNFVGVTKNLAKNEKDHHGISEFENIDDAIKTSDGIDGIFFETGKELQVPPLPSDSLISLDSLEYPQDNKDEQVCNTYTELEFMSHDSDKHSYKNSKMDTETGQSCAFVPFGFEIESSHSDFNTKNAFDKKSVCIGGQSSSDSRINSCTTDIKDNSDDLLLSTPIQNNYGNSCQSHEKIKREDSDKNEVKHAETRGISQNHNADEARSNQESDMQIVEDVLIQTLDEVYFRIATEDDVKTCDGLFSFDKSAEDEIDEFPLCNLQTETQFDPKFCRTDSYEEAMSNGQRPETATPNKENKLNVGKTRSLLKIPFLKKKKTPVTKKKDKKSKSEKTDVNLTVLDNDGNVQDSPNTSNAEKCLLEKDAAGKARKLKRRKWMKYFLCLPIKEK